MTDFSYSAVIIARNEEMHIRKTVESLLNQTIRPYRIVVVDDGSTDTTAAILKEMDVDIVSLPVHDDNHKVYYDTLPKIRNKGMWKVRDDPVDWVYSGDSDIILPKAYCETIMKQAHLCDAYIGAGIERDKLDQLPMEGCCMIKHDWLRSEGMHLQWESVWVCVKALAAGHNTMVRYADDCVVTSQRPTGATYTIGKRYQHGALMRKMGAPIPYMCWKVGVVTKIWGVRAGWRYLRGWCGTKVEVPDSMSHVYRSILYEHLRVRLFGRLGRRHHMFSMYDGNMVCRSGSN